LLPVGDLVFSYFILFYFQIWCVVFICEEEGRGSACSSALLKLPFLPEQLVSVWNIHSTKLPLLLCISVY